MNYYCNEIKKAFEKGEIIHASPFDKPKDYFTAIGTMTDSLSYKDDFINELMSILNSIYIKENIINKKIAFRKFKEHILWYIFIQKINSLGIDDDGIKKMFDEMYNKEIKPYSVFSDVNGIHLENNSKIYSVSVFNIYYWSTAKTEIEKRTEANQDVFWRNKKYYYLIETTVEAADDEKAIELATSLFEKFQYFMHIVIGTKEKRFNISINSEKSVYAKNTLLLCNEDIISNISLENMIDTIPIDKYLSDNNQKHGFEEMWNLLKQKEPNEFQKRLILALEWLGQAYYDNSFQNSFIKAVISLEIIFSYNEETIITPSILHQISENAALILGNNVDECIQIEREMKKLYGKRSSIVHAGNSDIDIKMIMDILNYSSCILLILLNKKEYRSIKSIKELYDLLKLKKYNNPQQI